MPAATQPASPPAPPRERARAIWITWEQHRRSTVLARHFDIPLHCLEHDGPSASRHVALTARTILVLLRQRPHLVVVQNPSLILTLIGVLMKWVLRYRLVVDAHNCAILPSPGHGRLRSVVASRLLGRADHTIVSNRFLTDVVTRAGGHALVLPDKVPEPRDTHVAKPAGGVVLIASFADDEPIEEVVSAFSRLRQDVTLSITGDFAAHRHRLPQPLPQNIRLSGHLPEPEYWRLLQGADVIVDLSLMPDCLVCGAYEAIAVGVPMVLSDDRAVRAYFSRGATYASPEASSIAAAMTNALSERSRLASEVVELREQLAKKWPEMADRVQDYLVGQAPE